jgi:hypothetical protein
MPDFFCRSWLASEEARQPNTKFKTAFAGKPAPTVPANYHDVFL